MIFTVGGAMLVGLFGIAYLQKFDVASMQRFDGSKELAETIIYSPSRVLFSSLHWWLPIVGYFSGRHEYNFSQLLVTSSSMTEDIYKTFFNKQANAKNMLLMSRISVLLVAIVALILSLNPKDSILNLVGNAWAGFGAAFGPIIILSLVWKRTTALAGLVGMLVGGTVVLLWVYLPHPYKALYEMIPGFISSFLSIVIISLMSKPVSPAIQEEFEEVNRLIKKG